MSEPLAHSARVEQGIGPQTYREHVCNVAVGCRKRAETLLNHYFPAKGWPTRECLLDLVGIAADFHDLGKLDPGFQKTLEDNRVSEEHIRHEDAGAAWLIQNAHDTENSALLEAAALIAAHHQGLVHYRVETDNESGDFVVTDKLAKESFRNQDEKTRCATELRLQDYLETHISLLGEKRMPTFSQSVILNGLTRRLLLSCLVDADHSDTAQHYQNEREINPPDTRWGERLEKLKSYVAGLKKSGSSTFNETERQRQDMRDQLFELCCDANTGPRLRSCDAVVGSGKTTALMVHLLQVAIARNLRHIIIVLPFTNIITQSVEVYRKALCLEGETPEEVVAEHHHQVEFSDPEIRHLTTTWQAPIIVTTAVQFFETLAANNTSRLRKLHELPGSAVFLDEAHAALPASLWPVCWNWLTQWTRRWNGHLVMASGSLPEFWVLPEFQCLCEGQTPGEQPTGPQIKIPPLAPSLKEVAEVLEYRRVKLITAPMPLSVEDLTDQIINSKGPRIVVVNTVQSAAFLAAHLRDTTRKRVLHLSTALSPAHREIIVRRIKGLLKYQTDWILVATSLVEAGMDFSFVSGFRQRASTASLIQLSGRVNRSAKWENDPFVLDFTFKEDKRFPDNPSLKPSQEALKALFSEDHISSDKPADLTSICLQALSSEFRAGTQETAAKLIKMEGEANYPDVARNCRVIQSDTRTIVVDPEIAERIRMRKPVSRIEVTKNSVQMFHTKIEKLGIPPVRSDLDIFQLPESWDYDPDFLGYMAETIRLSDAEIGGDYFL